MKLIKLSSTHFIVVDDSEIKEGDWVSTEENTIHQVDYVDVYTKINNWKKITHSTQPLESRRVGIKPLDWIYNKIQPLDLSEVKELIGEVDVEKKADETANLSYKIKTFPIDVYKEILHQRLGFYEGYKVGYNQALKDNKDRDKTTEILNHLCDKMEMITQEMIDKDSFQLGRYRTFKYVFDYIKSLTQPKDTWDVEIIDGQLKLKQ